MSEHNLDDSLDESIDTAIQDQIRAEQVTAHANRALMQSINAQPAVMVNGFSILETPKEFVRLSFSEAIAPNIAQDIRFVALMTFQAFEDFLDGANKWRDMYQAARADTESVN